MEKPKNDELVQQRCYEIKWLIGMIKSQHLISSSLHFVIITHTGYVSGIGVHDRFGLNT